jgi:F-type H+-transporting ATPase subunit b
MLKIFKNLRNSSQYKSNVQNSPKIVSFNSLKKINSKDAASMILNVVLILPSYAGKVFDFNATLPIIAAQFILLVVFLDKTWFGPVGEMLDARDAMIQNRLMSVKFGYDELEVLLNSADTLLKDARADAQTEIADAKGKTAAKAEAELVAEKSKLDFELVRAINDLKTDRLSAKEDIERQVVSLTEYIIKIVLPNGFIL